MNDLAALVQDDRVHTSLYTDPAIFAEEMHRIFKRSWVWVAHASDVPGKNSFKTSYVGSQPVIVTRDRDGVIHVLLNRCRHRAASVCEKKQGKASVFVCPYHGWSYDVDGRLRKVPHAKGYPEDFDTTQFPLIRLRTEQYNGMIFATFRDDIEPLETFLGPARKWIDLFMKQGGGYGVKTLGEHRFRFPGNWKIQLENTTDAYHFPIVHKTFLDSLDAETEEVFDVLGKGGWVEDLGNGHSVMVMMPNLVDLDDGLEEPVPERFKDLADALRAEGKAEADIRRIVRAVGGTGFNLNLFPNVACSMAFFRVLRPIDVNETEITHVALGLDGGPVAANRMRLRLHEHFQGPMGFGTPDDAEGWERVQRGARAGEDVWILLNRGVAAPEGRAEPGHLAGDVSAETGMRGAYRMWKRMMAYNRSFSETGRLANLSQPALSRTIRLLEEQLGTRLFDRDSRNVRLTQAGEMLLPIVERLTADFDHAFSDLALTFAGQRGRVVIGALPSVAGGVLPEAIASFKASHPQVEIVVRDHLSGTLQREMLERQIDLAITTETNATDIAFHPLFEEQLVLLLLPGSSLDQPGPSNWKIFADHPFIAMAPRSSVRQLTDAAFLKAGIEVPALYECGQFSTVAAMIGAGLGISAVPRSIVDMLPDTNLAWRPLHGPRVATMIGVAWPRARTLVPAAEAFRQHLIASVKRSDPGDVRLPKAP